MRGQTARIDDIIALFRAKHAAKRKPVPRGPRKHVVPPMPRDRSSRLKDCIDPMTTIPAERDGDRPECAHYHGCLDAVARRSAGLVRRGSGYTHHATVCGRGCPVGLSYVREARDFGPGLRSSGGWLAGEGEVWGSNAETCRRW
jgi:hypothetical protein